MAPAGAAREPLRQENEERRQEEPSLRVDVHENDGTHFALDLPLASDTSLSALRRLACGRLKDREVFALDPFAGRGAETGTTATERMVILPERPFQALTELNPPGFATVRKFVVNDAGRVLSY